MPIIIPPGFAQVTVKMLQGSTGRECTNVFGVALDDAVGGGDVTDLSDALAVQYKGWISTGSIYTGLRVLVGQDAADPTVFESVSGAGAGSQGGALTSPQVQALIKKSGASAARNNVGRTFIMDVTEANLDSAGNLSGAQLADLIDLAAGIEAAFSGGSPWNGIVLLHDTDDAPTPVVKYLAQSKCATLRPRFPRR